MVAADATVRDAHSRQTASRHRVLDANALSSRDSSKATNGCSLLKPSTIKQLDDGPGLWLAVNWLLTASDILVSLSGR
eukprot:4740555-Prymnesium_polylepis.1